MKVDLCVPFRVQLARRASFPEIVKFGLYPFHRELEEKHEEAMETALNLYENDRSIQRSFRAGASDLLDLLEGFWMGLDAKS